MKNKYVVGVMRPIQRASLADPSRKLIVEYVPDLTYGIHDTNFAAKKACVVMNEPGFAGCSDHLIKSHFDAQSRNLGHFKILKIKETPNETDC